MRVTIKELAKQIGAELAGDGSGYISSVQAIEIAEKDQVTFVSNEKHLRKLRGSKAGAVIVYKYIADASRPQLIVKNVDAALIKTLRIFAPELKPAAKGIHPTAKVGKDVRIGKEVSIGYGVEIEDEVEIGDNSIIASGCKVGEKSIIGSNSRLDSNVVVHHNCVIGSNVIIQSNTVIGSVGFGYAFIDGSHQLIPHNGRVVIEDFVEIGANCCIDRAKFGDTRIGSGTKIDNLVQIAHGVSIGKCCLIAGMVGIGGSCKIGDRVVLAGQVALVDHIEIGAGTVIGAKSLVTHSTKQNQVLFGLPAIEKNDALRVIGLTRRLPAFVSQLKDLTQKVNKLVECAEKCISSENTSQSDKAIDVKLAKRVV
jgi:UDP-3-O-[3-hydroxymyristoyl] glucosamine N-acyltransferase